MSASQKHSSTLVLRQKGKCASQSGGRGVVWQAAYGRAGGINLCNQPLVTIGRSDGYGTDFSDPRSRRHMPRERVAALPGVPGHGGGRGGVGGRLRRGLGARARRVELV